MLRFDRLAHTNDRAGMNRRRRKVAAQMTEQDVEHGAGKTDAQRQSQGKAHDAAHVDIGLLVVRFMILEMFGGIWISSVHAIFPPPSRAGRTPGTADAPSTARRTRRSRDRAPQWGRPNPSTKKGRADRE